MPAYDFVCQKCGVFEVFKGMNDPPPRKCPTCHGKDIERVFNTKVSFIPPVDAGWENENNGLGHYIGQLGANDDKNAYVRSRHLIPERAKRAGFTRIEKC